MQKNKVSTNCLSYLWKAKILGLKWWKSHDHRLSRWRAQSYKGMLPAGLKDHRNVWHLQTRPAATDVAAVSARGGTACRDGRIVKNTFIQPLSQLRWQLPLHRGAYRCGGIAGRQKIPWNHPFSVWFSETNKKLLDLWFTDDFCPISVAYFKIFDFFIKTVYFQAHLC